jgi:hypothetical protein
MAMQVQRVLVERPRLGTTRHHARRRPVRQQQVPRPSPHSAVPPRHPATLWVPGHTIRSQPRWVRSTTPSCAEVPTPRLSDSVIYQSPLRHSGSLCPNRNGMSTLRIESASDYAARNSLGADCCSWPGDAEVPRHLSDRSEEQIEAVISSPRHLATSRHRVDPTVARFSRREPDPLIARANGQLLGRS